MGDGGLKAGAVVAIGSGLFVAGCAMGWVFGSTTSSPDAAMPRIPVTPMTTPREDPLPRLTPSDFRVGITVTRVECFGSAGCNVGYLINPQYVGSAKLPSRTTVVYEVRGGDEPKTASFTVNGAGDADAGGQEHIRAQAGGSLEAVVTQVLPGR